MFKRCLLALMLPVLGGCSETLQDWVRQGEPSAHLAVARAPATALAVRDWQWQLSGVLNTEYSVDLYDVDLFDTARADIDALKARGITVICYFSAGTVEAWRSDAVLIPGDAQGDPLPDWPDERWLDITRFEVRAVMQARLDEAVSQGCDGVEPDNVDAFEQTTGLTITREDQINYNRFLATEAHARGLRVALKNAWALAPDLVNDFDLAVSEECIEQNACDQWAPFIKAGKPVLNAEYRQQWAEDAQAREAMCAESDQAGLLTLVLPRALDDQFRYSCQTP